MGAALVEGGEGCVEGEAVEVDVLFTSFHGFFSFFVCALFISFGFFCCALRTDLHVSDGKAFGESGV